MDEPLHHIDRLFQKAVEQHSERPSAKVWEHLERTLQKRNVSSINRKYKKWKWVAAALFIFSVALATYTFHLNSKYKKAIEKTPGNGELNNGNSIGGSTSFVPNADEQKTNKNVQSDEKTNPKVTIDNVVTTPPSLNNIKKTIVVNDPVIANSSKIANSQPVKTIQNTADNKKPAETPVATQNRKRPFEQNDSKPLNRPAVQAEETPGDIRTNSVKTAPQKAFDDISNAKTTANTVTSIAKQSMPVPYIVSASTISKNIDLSTGLAEIPPDILNGQPQLMPFLSLNKGAAVTKVANKSKATPVSVGINRGKFTVSIYYSQDFVSADIKANAPDFREDNYLQIKSHEKNRPADVVGLSVVRNMGRKLGVETGISLHTFITDLTAKPLVARKDNTGKINYRISSSSGYAYYSIKNRPNPPLADSIKTLSSRSKVKYLSVPIGLQYHFLAGKRLSFNPAAIFLANFLTQGNITTIQSLEHTYSNDIEGLKPHYFDAAFKLHIGYYLNRRIGISLIPSASFALSDATVEKPVTLRRNAVGVAAGLNFSF